MKNVAFLCSLCFLAIGCGDDGGVDGGEPDANEVGAACPGIGAEPANPGFICPTAVASVWEDVDGVPTEIGPADFSCLNTPTTDVPTNVAIDLTGTINDFQNPTTVDTPTVEVFSGVDIDNPLDTTTGGADGSYALTLPAGETRWGFKVTAADYMETYLLNQYFDPDTATDSLDIDAVSVNTANLIPAIIGITRTPGLGILAAAIRDCNGNTVKDLIATVSTTSGAHDHLDGGQTFYFNGGLPTNLTVMQQTNTDGLFVVLELPEAPMAYMQVWGFVDGQDPATDDVTLIAELASPIVGDTVITGSLFPLRTAN